MPIDDITGKPITTSSKRLSLSVAKRTNSSTSLDKNGNTVRTTKFSGVKAIAVTISKETYDAANATAKKLKIFMKTLLPAAIIAGLGFTFGFIAIFDEEHADILYAIANPLTFIPLVYLLVAFVLSRFLTDPEWEAVIAKKYQKKLREQTGDRDIFVFTTLQSLQLK
jgi:hypothetical protein